MIDSKSTLNISMESKDIDVEALQMHTTALHGILKDSLDEGEISFGKPKEAKPGQKGDPITIGTIILSLITSGSVVALINCLKTILSREKRLNISIATQNGDVISIDAKNINNESTKKLLNDILEKS